MAAPIGTAPIGTAPIGTAPIGHWCGNAIAAAPPTRARHRPLLSWTLLCPECGADCSTADCSTADHPHRPGDGRAHRPSFLDRIPVSEVLEEVSDLLGGVTAPAWTNDRAGGARAVPDLPAALPGGSAP